MLKKAFILAFLLSLKGGTSLMEEARVAFEGNRFEDSIGLYSLALERYPSLKEKITFNLAQAYMKLDSTSRASAAFHIAKRSGEAKVSSYGHNNLGVLLAKEQKYKGALAAFKQAILMHVDNEAARYNYELLKKMLQDDPPPQNPPPPDPPQTPPPSGEDSRPPRENYLSDLPQNLLQNQKDMRRTNYGDTLGYRASRQILDEMQNSPLQFLQQLRKAPLNLRKQGKERPNW